jgi:hypothetical protein
VPSVVDQFRISVTVKLSANSIVRPIVPHIL